MNAMQQVQVLVADDDETLLDMMARRLEKLGFEVDRAETGRAASVLLDRKGYDLVVTDIYMPEVTGLALLKLAKEKDAHIQVVVVTASATLETAIEALNAGAFAYLQKPFDHMSVFDNVISRAVEFRRLVLDNIRMAESQKRRGDMLEAEVTQRVKMTRQRQRELIDILACLPDGIVVVEEGGRVVLSSPVAEKWLAQELRTGEQPIQRYLETVYDEWAETETRVTLGDHDLKLMAFDLPAEDEKSRKVVMIRSMELDEAEIGEKLLEPVQDLKLGLSRLYKLTKDDQGAALLRQLAAQVSQLEELQRSLTATNGHLAPAVLPPSWQDKKDQIESRRSPREPSGEENELDVGSEMEGDPNDSLQPGAMAMQPPDAREAARDPEVSDRPSGRFEGKEAPVELVPADDSHQSADTGDLLTGKVVLLEGSDEHVPTDADLGAGGTGAAEVDEGSAKDRAQPGSPDAVDKGEERKALWQKAKERGWTTSLNKKGPKENSGAKPDRNLASPTVPSSDRIDLESPTIPHIKESGMDSQRKSPPANEAGKTVGSTEPRKPSEEQSSLKSLDDEEALEAFSVSLLEFEPKTQIHRRSDNGPQMNWPPPPPSQYNPEDYEELRG